MSKWLTILVSLMGFSLAVYVVATSGKKPPNPPPAAAPSVNPFAEGIAASGTVEAASRNISIAAPIAGLVIEVKAEVNDHVAKGQELFRLDTRDLQANLLKARAAQESAQAQLDKLNALPRPEELPPLRAAVERARSHLADVEDWHNSLLKAHEGDAASSSEIMRSTFNVQTARAELAAAQANYDLMASGAWEPDRKVARAAVDQAKADIDAVQLLVDRLTVRSPIDGVVLKRQVEPGRFAPADPLQPAMVVGDMSTINVRAQVDEEELSRLRPGARGAARLRGASTKTLPLKMLRIEPLAAPKVSLTGLNTERVDTRVVEVIFQVESTEGFTLYPGQIVDVYIDAGG